MTLNRLPDDPSCPVDRETKEWIDARASWLLGQFGQQTRGCDVVVPTAEFLSSSFRGTCEDAYELLDRVCQFMGIDAHGIELRLFAEQESLDGRPVPLGLYQQDSERVQVWVEVSLLQDQSVATAVMAHELGHVHLLGRGLVSEDDDDHEPFTDLLTVFLGLGVMTANAALYDSSWRFGGMEGWQIGRRGYLTMPMHGYALALFAGVRGEDRPVWAKYLRPDVRDAFRRSHVYFDTHGFPNLNQVRTTSARPTLVREEHDSNRLESTTDDDWPQVEDRVDVCSYCEAVLSNGDVEGICQACRSSIDENENERRTEIEEDERLTCYTTSAIRFGCLLAAEALVLLLLLEALGFWDWLMPPD